MPERIQPVTLHSPIPMPRPSHLRSILTAPALFIFLATTACGEPEAPESHPPASQGTEEAMEGGMAAGEQLTEEGSTDQLRATGTFEVTVTPRETDETPEGSRLGRSSLAKRLHGDLEGTADGTMLTALTPVEGSAGYVAIERVTGTLHGRRGTFLLQHHGLMDRQAQQLTITVIPDSGTGELEGLRGTMGIGMEDGTRTYELLYSLPGDNGSDDGSDDPNDRPGNR